MWTSQVLLALTLVIFHEDRRGTLLGQWAVAQTMVNRITDPTWNTEGHDPIALLRRPGQFSWWRRGMECGANWGPADNTAWRKAEDTARLVWISRHQVSHGYYCFHLNDGKHRRISRGRASRVYGNHVFWQCKG